METSLHRALKVQYGSGSGGRSEVTLKGFRIDAVDGARGCSSRSNRDLWARCEPSWDGCCPSIGCGWSNPWCSSVAS